MTPFRVLLLATTALTIALPVSAISYAQTAPTVLAQAAPEPGEGRSRPEGAPKGPPREGGPAREGPRPERPAAPPSAAPRPEAPAARPVAPPAAAPRPEAPPAPRPEAPVRREAPPAAETPRPARPEAPPPRPAAPAAEPARPARPEVSPPRPAAEPPAARPAAPTPPVTPPAAAPARPNAATPPATPPSVGGAKEQATQPPVAPPAAAPPPAAATPPAGTPPGPGRPDRQGRPGGPGGAGAPNAATPGAPPAAAAPPAPAAPNAAAPAPGGVGDAKDQASRPGPVGRPLPPPAAAPLPPPPPAQAAAPAVAPGAQPPGPQNLNDFRGQRREVREGGRTVITEPGRVIIEDPSGRSFIRHNEVDRFRYGARDVQVIREGRDTRTVVVRPDGTQIITVTGGDGQLLRRIRRDDRGREVIIIDNSYRDPGSVGGFYVDLPPPVIRIPRERYIVESEYASPELIYDTMLAPPVERVQRRYSLDEIRYSPSVRQLMPSIDLDTINFETGSWEIPPDQAAKLQVIADGLKRAIERNPREVFLIEGHTDAVGSDVDNLSLSDRRAQSAAELLTRQFQVPEENLTSQGYGKQYLKIPTDAAERRNRRVTVRRITPLLNGGQASLPPPPPGTAPPR